MRAITVTLGLALAAGTLVVAAPALATSPTQVAPTPTSSPVHRREEAIRAKLGAVKDPVERKKLEADLMAQIKAVPVGAAETGLGDTASDPATGPFVSGWEIEALAGAGAGLLIGGVVFHRRRRRTWLSPA